MRLHRPLRFFIDRSLGRSVVPAALRAALEAGEEVHAHDDLLPQDSEDQAWLTLVGQNGWPAFTKDSRILWNPLEQRALLSAGAAVFVLKKGSLPAERQAEVLVACLPGARRLLTKPRLPLIATIDGAGGLHLTWEGGSRLAKPRTIK